MNKRNLIRDIKAWGAWCTDHNTGEKDRYVKIDKVRELIEQLDEQTKVTVPKFVADWFEANKYRLEIAIWDLTTDAYVADQDELSEIQLWLKESDRPYEILIRMKDGYVIDKEPLYYVYLPEILTDVKTADIEGSYLMKSDDEIELADNNGFDEMKFTESEIKALDERYLAFAVPVESNES